MFRNILGISGLVALRTQHTVLVLGEGAAPFLPNGESECGFPLSAELSQPGWSDEISFGLVNEARVLLTGQG